MRKKILAGVGALALASSTVVLSALPANAEDIDIWFPYDLYSDTGVIPWTLPAGSPEICDDPEISSNPGSIDPSVVVIDDSRLSGRIDLSNIDAGDYELIIECDEDVYWFAVDFARYTITKEVEGDAPADAEFSFEVTAQPDYDAAPFIFDFTLQAGESASFYDFSQTQWSVEETDNAGAIEVRAEDTDFISSDAEDFTATIVNVFPTAEDPEPEPDPEPQPQPEPKPQPTASDETPAPPVKAKPAFTG